MSASPAPGRWRLLLAALLAALAGCGPDVPANPTWEHDVFPIIRARCIHCHYPMDPALPLESDAANYDYPEFAAVPANVVDILRSAGVTDVQTGRMPKPPAAPLADWQVETLVRWARNPQ